MVAALLLCSSLAAAKCIPFQEAENRIGDQVCVTGKVVKVAQGRSGTLFLNFCKDYRKCPFSVVVFRSNLRDVGDVRALEGKTIEIFGKIKSWGGHAEIVLREARQLKGESAKIPPVPKEYDVQRKGKYSPKAPSSQSKKPAQE
jgi:DNA/RNA endonuclease YhcR with UshA esterase domain